MTTASPAGNDAGGALLAERGKRGKMLPSYKIGATRMALAKLLSEQFDCFVSPALLKINTEDRAEMLSWMNPRVWSWYYDAGDPKHPLYDCGSTRTMTHFLRVFHKTGQGARIERGADGDLFILPLQQKGDIL